MAFRVVFLAIILMSRRYFLSTGETRLATAPDAIR